MKYDFDTVYDRKHTGSMKWSVPEGTIPMWVADMDFKTAPEITEALKKRAEHGIFGYTEISDDWYDAYIGWWERRHGFKMNPYRLMFCTGVVAAISSIVRKLTTPNENVLIQTPVYNIFFNSIVNNGCRVLENKLIYKDGEYNVDFEDLEAKLSDPQTTLMILCNPHNPIGKIWDKETLSRIGNLCKENKVTVISDEIHCDVTVPGKSYIPFASVSEICRDISITCISPTKTFNLAGLQTAAIYVPDRFLHHKVWRGINTDEVAEPNCFAALAPIAAFNEGEAWADEMNSYVAENRKTAEDFLSKNVPFVKTVKGEATYLLWIDISAAGNSDFVSKYLKNNSGLKITSGTEYGSNGEGFVRMNLACPRILLMEGLKRFGEGLNTMYKLKT
ncbi:MAG: pyridoxal phosphate-dependent aminotransferase [Lachnospiraceae bacterium]|nr:pyridoxal phosphate-dependent aminotransferase [Lachnospiraceae bacterium]